MSGISLREPSLEDAPAIAEYINEHARAVFGEAELTEEEVRHWFTLPEVWMRVAERDGRIAGYLDLAAEGAGKWDIDARSLDRDVAALLVATAEERAGRGRLHGYAPAADSAVAAAYEDAGFVRVRSSFRMLVELEDEPEPPSWPEGITVRPGDRGRADETLAYRVSQESFADHWDFHPEPEERWRRWNVEAPRFDPSLWFFAEDGGEVAGVSLCAWHHSGDPELGWVGTLGVRRPWRRRGLGLALLLHSFAELRKRGATRVGLGVDAENTTGAVRLYERAGMRVTRRSDTWEKVTGAGPADPPEERERE